MGERAPQDQEGDLKFHAQLICWHCGASKSVLTEGPPRSSIELAGWAEVAGMKSYFDLIRGRLLLFCSEEHAREEMTKDGRFRLRPKRKDSTS